MRRDKGNMPNVFEIWRDLGRVVPFKVRRWSWAEGRFATVVRVANIKENPDGRIYGYAFVSDLWFIPWESKLMKKLCEPGESFLQCAGCYQWELVLEKKT